MTLGRKQTIKPFRRKKGAFDRFTSSQVHEDGSKVLNQEPTQETVDLRHGWWDPMFGTSPLSSEEARKKTEEAEARRIHRRDQKAARKAGGLTRPGKPGLKGRP